jgi:xanthine/uracil permease
MATIVCVNQQQRSCHAIPSGCSVSTAGSSLPESSALFAALFISRLLPLLPPVVTGTIIGDSAAAETDAATAAAAQPV